MQQVSLEEAKADLDVLIEAAIAGEDVFIKKDDRLTVQLVPHIVSSRKRQFGSAKGLIAMAPDFDEPLDDFKEYL
jgi:antitoxin (DNA-binding transcriptional repressor) of toxin-antitoxin stability system